VNSFVGNKGQVHLSDSSVNVEVVHVETSNSAGTAVADRSFHLIVVC
jgi:hypothetical protein